MLDFVRLNGVLRAIVFASASCVICAAGANAATGITRVEADAHRLREGIFTYHDLDRGKDVGKGKITIHRLADTGDYVFAADSTFAADFSGFHSQRWRAVATRAFEPVSATLSFVGDSEVAPIFDLQYSQGRVTGYAIDYKSPARAKRSVMSSVPADTVDQRIDWAAVISGELEPGREFAFHVYDPKTGVGLVTSRVDGLEQIRVPAGTFRAYRIAYQMEKSGRTEHYQVFASETVPRMMLREDFPNGVVSELIHVQSGSQ